MTFFFLLVSILIVLYQKYREGRWVNLLSLFMVPYIIIVFFNNLIIYRLGFYKISNEVLLMLTASFIVFFLGTLPFRFKIRNFSNRHNVRLLEKYNIKAMNIFLYITGALGIIKAYLFYRQGLLFADNTDSEGVMTGGLIGHMLMASYSILPIYFLNWTYHKRILDLIPVIMIIITAFSTLIKYNVIGPIVCLFIFVCIYRRSLLKKAFLIFPILIGLFFIANYAIGFALSGASPDYTFYLGHFWKYFAGSLIYDNYIFTSGFNLDIGLFEKVGRLFIALPNMFIDKIFNVSFLMRDRINPELDVGFGEGSNVADVFGYLYPSHCGFGDILWFFIIIFLSAFAISYIYIKCCSFKNRYSTFIANFLTYFIFLDFFAPFFTLSSPWEILVWCLILPPLFRSSSECHKRSLVFNYTKMLSGITPYT